MLPELGGEHSPGSSMFLLRRCLADEGATADGVARIAGEDAFSARESCPVRPIFLLKSPTPLIAPDDISKLICSHHRWSSLRL
jgi:hypothetical protein